MYDPFLRDNTNPWGKGAETGVISPGGSKCNHRLSLESLVVLPFAPDISVNTRVESKDKRNRKMGQQRETDWKITAQKRQPNTQVRAEGKKEGSDLDKYTFLSPLLDGGADRSLTAPVRGGAQY